MNEYEDEYEDIAQWNITQHKKDAYSLEENL